jgi:hypothetical protein
MTTPVTDHDRALRRYAKLVAQYPRAHRDRFAPQMQRTFEDLYRHATAGERRVGIGFWLAVLSDEGRSIMRERAAEPQGDVLFYAMVVIWLCAALIVPVIPAVSDWRNLVLPTVVLAGLFLTVPGCSGVARTFVTVVLALGIAEFMTAIAGSMKIPNDLLAPALLLICMAFVTKSLAGLNARVARVRDAVWDREEVAYGVLAGVAGVVGLAPGMVSTDDNNPALGLVFFLIVPFVCAVAGFKSSARHMSARWGIYAALGSLLIAATIWIVALPLLYEGAVVTVFRDRAAPALLPFYWQRPLSSILFWAAVNGITGAYLGMESTRKDVPAVRDT